jgi:hypothetical protein
MFWAGPNASPSNEWAIMMLSRTPSENRALALQIRSKAHKSSKNDCIFWLLVAEK